MRGAALALAALAACSNDPDNLCQVDADCDRIEGCEDGCHCQDGQCVEGRRACGAIVGACPEDQNCCAGFCSRTICCTADFECVDGHCSGGRCRPGERSTCTGPDQCGDDHCLVSLGQCVECIYSDDCRSVDLWCSPSHTCVPVGSGCTPAGCAQQGKICGAEGQCRDCVSAAECGDLVCVAGNCLPCTTVDSCGLGRHCDGGACVNDPEIECTSNAECGELFCLIATGTCQACALDSECGPGRFCQVAEGTCHAEDPDCFLDGDCAPPATVCVAGLCTPGCIAGACGGGQVCSPTTGRCTVVSEGDLLLGAACSTHESCQSGVCWGALLQGTPINWCSKACVRHDDCPADFVCYELSDGNACIQKTTFPGLDLDVPPGGACSGAFLDGDCMTGYCDTGAGTCMEMCGRDADCADRPGTLCASRWTVAEDENLDGVIVPSEILGFTQLCYPPLPSDPLSACDPNIALTGEGLDPGARCVCHDDCKHGYCAQSPDYTLEPRCAEPCCTPFDCDPSRGVCKPLWVWDGIWESGEPWGFQKMCLWREYQGDQLVGELCAEDDDCRSEICVAGPSGVKRCTHTCCTDRDCANYDWAGSCRTPFNPPSPVADQNVDDIQLSLGRWSITSAGVSRSPARTTLCMPR